MKVMEISKKDWKLFREKIGSWQEEYMERLIKQYVDFLSSDEAASTKFWKMDKRIKQDKKKLGVCLELNKHEMLFDIVRLLKDGVISFDDLVDFSDELKENVKALQQRVSN